jgi:beta-glucosidase-like glycosyl hydrolase
VTWLLTGLFIPFFSQAEWDNRRWKRSLLRARGGVMGKEDFGKGVIIALGPMMNIGRVAQGGCNWEGSGTDPFLTGVGAYETILGMRSAGVQACAKHYINKWEIFRNVAANKRTSVRWRALTLMTGKTNTLNMRST